MLINKKTCTKLNFQRQDITTAMGNHVNNLQRIGRNSELRYIDNVLEEETVL